jgi:hypothetical protein
MCNDLWYQVTQHRECLWQGVEEVSGSPLGKQGECPQPIPGKALKYTHALSLLFSPPLLLCPLTSAYSPQESAHLYHSFPELAHRHRH